MQVASADGEVREERKRLGLSQQRRRIMTSRSRRADRTQLATP
jgi:hypothetical protein